MSMDYYESFFEGYVATLGMGSYIFSFAVYVFEVICLWKVFEKAGKPGWASLIPVYNMWIFFEMAGFSETSYCNERILMQVILDYFMDVMRLKEFHSIERIRTEKLFAYTISWIVRRKPIQFRDYSEEERDIFINERFAAYLLINECLMCGTKHFVQEAYAEKLVEYTEMLLYYFKYRQCDPKTLELLIESFKMGGLVH